MQVLLPAERVDTDSQSSARLGKVWGSFSDTISLKAFAIKVRAASTQRTCDNVQSLESVLGIYIPIQEA